MLYIAIAVVVYLLAVFILLAFVHGANRPVHVERPPRRQGWFRLGA